MTVRCEWQHNGTGLWKHPLPELVNGEQRWLYVCVSSVYIVDDPYNRAAWWLLTWSGKAIYIPKAGNQEAEVEFEIEPIKEKTMPADAGANQECPVFEIGDAVECEFLDDGYPRWVDDLDYLGVEGKKSIGYRQSNVHRVDSEFVYCFYPEWAIPLPMNALYSPDQWDRPGYLRKVQKEEAIGLPSGINCRCIIEPIATKPQAICRCNIAQLCTNVGHDPDCPEKGGQR